MDTRWWDKWTQDDSEKVLDIMREYREDRLLLSNLDEAYKLLESSFLNPFNYNIRLGLKSMDQLCIDLVIGKRKHPPLQYYFPYNSYTSDPNFLLSTLFPCKSSKMLDVFKRKAFQDICFSRLGPIFYKILNMKGYIGIDVLILERGQPLPTEKFIHKEDRPYVEEILTKVIDYDYFIYIEIKARVLGLKYN